MLSSLKLAAALASSWKRQRWASKALSSPSAGSNMPNRSHNPESWEVMTSDPAAWQPQWLTNSKEPAFPLKAATSRQLYVSAYSCTSDLSWTSKLNATLPGSCPGTDRSPLACVNCNRWQQMNPYHCANTDEMTRLLGRSRINYQNQHG